MIERACLLHAYGEGGVGAVVVWEGNAKKYENEEEGGWGGFDNDGIHTLKVSYFYQIWFWYFLVSL